VLHPHQIDPQTLAHMDPNCARGFTNFFHHTTDTTDTDKEKEKNMNTGTDINTGTDKFSETENFLTGFNPLAFDV
jgi:hypothetical protein